MRTCTNPSCRHPNRDTARVCAKCGRLLPGVILDRRYRIGRLLAKSEMSAVYTARDQRFQDHPCVVKEMLAYFASPQEQQIVIQLFEQEAVILRKLGHSYIPRVIDHFCDRQRHYLAMDYVEGESLEEILASRGQPGLPEEEVLEWALQLCEVLEYLHGWVDPGSGQPRSVIFRDLKPSNIMLDKNGYIKLVDFGIARFFKPGQSKDTRNMGTPGYAAPEQYGGQTDARSDIYALGATLHHLLTGRDPQLFSPFTFPYLRSLIPTLSSGMEAIVSKALSMRVEERYQSAREMREALEDLKGIFDLSVDFVHPCLYMHEAPLCQMLLSISSKDLIDPVQSPVVTHFCLVLDVSTSMKVETGTGRDVEDEKFRPLLRAVRHFIESVPEHYMLTIALFSEKSDLVQSLKPAAGCQNALSETMRAIEESDAARSSGRQTYLAPALSMALDKIRLLQRPGVVHRLCILTDGQVHDDDQCSSLFNQLRSSDIEVYAYGFGADWEIEPLMSMLSGCQGGSFKPVAAGKDALITTYDIETTFGRMAQASQNIVATDAELEVTFAQDVIPGDAFRYMPIARYLGSNAYDKAKAFKTRIGSLEQSQNYSYCFEARLQPTQQSSQQIGMVTLHYTHQGRRATQRRPITVDRTPDKNYAEQVVRQDIKEAFLILEALRSKDPQTLLTAFRARLDLLIDQGGDQRQIRALQNAIQELQRYGSLDGLSQEDQIWVHTDSRGQTAKIPDGLV